MQRRNFLIGAAGTAIGGSALVGSGAFSSVEADRTAEVNVAADNDAYLGLRGDGDFVSDDGDSGELSFDFGGDSTNEGGEGFNERAKTVVSDVITVENQGTQDVTDVGFGSAGTYSTTLDLEDGSSTAEVTLEIDDDELDLTPGDTTSINVTVDTREDPDQTDSSVDVTIVAEN